jgi:predicted DNA-binding protein (UPF0251 family)
MPRPEKKRRIRCCPVSYYFKPAGIPVNDLEEIPLAADELEAIRLADLNELFQEEAAEKMNVSRATFGRILMRAHNKIADAIINGKAINISENLSISVSENSLKTCKGCGRKFRRNLQNNKCHKCLSIS